MGPSTMMKLACALLLLVAAVSCAPTTPDTLVAEDSKFVPGYGMPSVSMPWGPPIDWGAIADTIAKQLDDYYEIEIDLSQDSTPGKVLQSTWPGRACPCMNNDKVRSFYQCSMPNEPHKYLELVRLTRGTNWAAEMEACAKKDGSSLAEQQEEFNNNGGKYE